MASHRFYFPEYSDQDESVTFQDNAVVEEKENIPRKGVPTPGGEEIPFAGDTLPVMGFATLAQAVYLSGKLPAPPLCSGMSLCGRCRMKVTANAPCPVPADTEFFCPEEIAAGWRLGCRHKPVPGMVVEVPLEPELSGKVKGHKAALPDPSFCKTHGQRQAPELRKAGLAVDLGTTSLHWMLLDADGITSSGSMLNPQMGAGSDVISRLAVARTPLGGKRLSELVVRELTGVIRHAEAGGRVVTELCLAANPAMTAIALGKGIEGLAAAPYALPLAGGTWESLSPLPPVWVPPQLSPFVGGDISAGYAALVFAKGAQTPEFPFLLADMGTNGEFVLALSPDNAMVASVALGPALEGIGLSCGMEAGEGAVTDFSLTSKGLEPVFFQGAKTADHVRPHVPRGITGTGYLSLVRRLLLAGALSREGRFTGRGMLSRYFERLRPAHGSEDGDRRSFSKGTSGIESFLPLPGGLYLSAGDVEEILKVKAAFSLGLCRLLDVAGIASSSLKAVYLAGALGGNMDPAALEAAGFFPQGTASRVRVAGNTSLTGAALLLQDRKTRDDLVAWATHVEALDLASDNEFLQGFSHHMVFSWKPEGR